MVVWIGLEVCVWFWICVENCFIRLGARHPPDIYMEGCQANQSLGNFTAIFRYGQRNFLLGGLRVHFWLYECLRNVSFWEMVRMMQVTRAVRSSVGSQRGLLPAAGSPCPLKIPKLNDISSFN